MAILRSGYVSFEHTPGAIPVDWADIVFDDIPWDLGHNSGTIS